MTARLGGTAAGYLHGLTAIQPDPLLVLIPHTSRVRAATTGSSSASGRVRSRATGNPPRLLVEDTCECRVAEALDVCAPRHAPRAPARCDRSRSRCGHPGRRAKEPRRHGTRPVCRRWTRRRGDLVDHRRARPADDPGAAGPCVARAGLGTRTGRLLLGLLARGCRGESMSRMDVARSLGTTVGSDGLATWRARRTGDLADLRLETVRGRRSGGRLPDPPRLGRIADPVSALPPGLVGHWGSSDRVVAAPVSPIFLASRRG